MAKAEACTCKGRGFHAPARGSGIPKGSKEYCFSCKRGEQLWKYDVARGLRRDFPRLYPVPRRPGWLKGGDDAK